MPVMKQTIPSELNRKIHDVETQLRRRAALGAWVRFGLAALVMTLVATMGLAWAEGDIVARRWILGTFGGASLLAFWRLVIVPSRRKISAEQVALYIDEHHPELENRIISAVEFSRGEQPAESAWFIERFLKESRYATREISFSDMIDGPLLARHSTTSIRP